MLFLMALISIFIGIVLTLKQQSNSLDVSSTVEKSAPKREGQPIELSISDNSDQMAIVDSQNEPQQEQENAEKSQPEQQDNVANADEEVVSAVQDATSTLEDIAHLSMMSADELAYIDIQDGELDEPESSQAIDENATSYEDDFVAQDDIDDETILRLQEEATKKQDTKKDDLPPEAEQALSNFLDVADQAMRIQNQFSYTVTRGDRLKDVFEQSGLGGATRRVTGCKRLGLNCDEIRGVNCKG